VGLGPRASRAPRRRHARSLHARARPLPSLQANPGACLDRDVLPAARQCPDRWQGPADSVSGLGHRRVAELVARPHTAVRGWVRRAQRNADWAWSHALRWAPVVDPTAEPSSAKATSPLAHLVEAIGHAVAAWARRQGPVADPWHVAVLVTGGLVLAPLLHGPGRHRLDSARATTGCFDAPEPRPPTLTMTTKTATSSPSSTSPSCPSSVAANSRSGSFLCGPILHCARCFLVPTSPERCSQRAHQRRGAPR
jgi:hypothetical protein